MSNIYRIVIDCIKGGDGGDDGKYNGFLAVTFVEELSESAAFELAKEKIIHQMKRKSFSDSDVSEFKFILDECELGDYENNLIDVEHGFAYY